MGDLAPIGRMGLHRLWYCKLFPGRGSHGVVRSPKDLGVCAYRIVPRAMVTLHSGDDLREEKELDLSSAERRGTRDATTAVSAVSGAVMTTHMPPQPSQPSQPSQVL